MRHGDVVPTKNLAVVLGADGKATASFKAPKGQQFVLLLLGVEDTRAAGQKLDPVAALNALGWFTQEASDGG